MVKKQIVDFLKQAQKLKLSVESIGRELIRAGHNISDVDDALKTVKPLKKPKAPSAPEAALKTPSFVQKEEEK